MILTIIAIVLTILILKQVGIFKGSTEGIKQLAIAGLTFALIRGIIKLLAPIFIMLSSVIMLDLIIWLGVNVFCDHGYTFATWRFFRAVFLDMPF